MIIFLSRGLKKFKIKHVYRDRLGGPEITNNIAEKL